MPKTNLIVNFYIDKNPERQSELDFCMQKNIENALVDSIVVVIGMEHLEYFNKKFHSDKISLNVDSNRPTFNKFFEIASGFPECINIISNTDIYFNETLQMIKDYYLSEANRNTCMCLSRWDYNADGSITHYDHTDSQDVFLFYGKPRNIAYGDFRLGTRGCDNRICHEFKQAGYKVVNPSKSIQAIHLHLTNIRNYSMVGDYDLVKPPYYTFPTCTINEAY